jgi:hypothetical protein
LLVPYVCDVKSGNDEESKDCVPTAYQKGQGLKTDPAFPFEFMENMSHHDRDCEEESEKPHMA